MKRAKSNRYFTLLELLIVLALLSLVAGVGAFNIQRLFTKQRTLNEMEAFLNQLRNATELMTLCGVDGEIRVATENGKWTSEWRPSTPLSEKARKLIKTEKETYSYLQDFSYNDAPQFTLGFYSKGFFMSEGIVKLRGNGIVRTITLRGYPSPLKLSEKAEEAELSLEKMDEVKDRTQTILQETR
jgi:prepilin-type N-terminal cleavage/methylation domain-containing protein